MADWRQVQARIRKAKASPDAAAKLAELYEHTRDAMVAFELAQWQEKAGEHSEAARWYTAAAERFRRAQWKTKAEEALTRLGAPIPDSAPKETAGSAAPDLTSVEEDISSSVDIRIPLQPFEGKQAGEPEPLIATEGQPASQPSVAAQPERKGRRRGRRGGRNHRRGRTTGESASIQSPVRNNRPAETQPRAAAAPPSPSRAPAPQEEAPEELESPAEHVREAAAPATWHTRSRAGDPALASRMAHLESQLRRLLASPLASLDQAEQAPAGPGVLLLSDSDQVTHYYIEACQTLRIAIGNLLRGGRASSSRGMGPKDSVRLKEKLAENLGIGETRVARYLKDHCAVRWIQLDEGASELAHFAIAVLRPAVNE